MLGLEHLCLLADLSLLPKTSLGWLLTPSSALTPHLPSIVSLNPTKPSTRTKQNITDAHNKSPIQNYPTKASSPLSLSLSLFLLLNPSTLSPTPYPSLSNPPTSSNPSPAVSG